MSHYEPNAGPSILRIQSVPKDERLFTAALPWWTCHLGLMSDDNIATCCAVRHLKWSRLTFYWAQTRLPFISTHGNWFCFQWTGWWLFINIFILLCLDHSWTPFPVAFAVGNMCLSDSWGNVGKWLCVPAGPGPRNALAWAPYRFLPSAG